MKHFSAAICGHFNLIARSLIALCATATFGLPAHADDWQPVTPEQLKMTSDPKAPGASAIILYRQIDRDDNASFETVYTRIKIFTDEGRKYADVELTYDKARERIRNIQARTIRPDGSIINFDGTIFEKPIVKSRGAKVLAKAFTLPDVQAGTIIEYRYRHELTYGVIFDSHWILSQELFIKEAKYSLEPYRGFNMNYSWPIGLPPNTNQPRMERGKVRLETHDVAAFVTEEYMPPENQLKHRVDFVYSAEASIDKDPVVFWKKFGKQNYRAINDFVDKRRAMEEAAAQIVQPSDAPETKLRKIYARTQQIRNTTFERKKTDQEIEREDKKNAKNVSDVWKLGYGDANQVNWLFLALLRAAGIEADPVYVCTRDAYFFNERIMNPAQLNSSMVVVKLDGKDVYFDPGTAYAPFGVVPWNETAVRGLRLNKDGGDWIATPLPAPSDSRVDRKANLHLTTSGTLEGKLTVTYVGLEAFWRRLSERDEDDADRKQFLEDQIKADVPSGIDVTLSNQPVWNSSDLTLVAEFDLRVPGWASAAGQRALVPVGIFGGREKSTFKHATRKHPLYFNFPFQTTDDITIELPTGWQVNSVPPTHTKDVKVASYNSVVEDKGTSVHLKREFVANLLLLDSKYYLSLRDFFQDLRSGDEEQIVVAPAKTSTRK